MVRQAAPGVPAERVRRRHPELSAGAGARLAAAALIAAVVVGCATVPRLPGERRDDKLEVLEARVLELQQKAAVQEVELGRLRQQVTSLEARLAARGGATPSRSGAAPSAGSDASARVASSGGVAPPVATPGARATGGPTTASGTRPSASAAPPAGAPSRTASPNAPAAARTTTSRSVPSTTLEESELPPDEPIAPPAAAAPASPSSATPRPAPAPPRAAAAPPASSPSAAAAAGGEGEPVPREAQAVYDEAYTYFHQGKYAQAEARFEEFLAESPTSELSDNAQYWIGAARYARGDYNGALSAFRKTVERYPDANKVPDALYKMGQAFEELREKGQALAVYDEIVRRFPDTAAATLAAERQAKLGQ